MKNILFILALFISQILSAQTDPQMILDLEDIVCKERAHAEQFHAPHSRNEFAAQTDMHYQIMKWEIDPADYYIKGEIDYYFKSLVPGLNQLVLDLTNALQINSIKRNGVDLAFTHNNDQLLFIQLGKTLNAGAFDTLTINYEGTPPSNGFGSFEQATHQDTPVIWTLSEPYGVRDWWPAKQDLIDKIDSVDIYITTPTGNLAASNGKLLSITETDGKLLHHWQHRYPIASYLVALAVTNYDAYSQYVYLANGDSIEVLNYIYPEHVNAAKEATTLTVNFISFYNELFGLYPFAEEKYGHAQFGWGGGMEHQTMSFMGSFGYDLQAHELAHQWFGDKVTTGSWEDIWLNEGFATYLTGLTYERFSPGQYWPIWKSTTSNAATSQPGGSVWVDDTTNVNRIFSGRLSYSKGAYVLHMARWVTNNDSTFFRAVRNYLYAPGISYEFARTKDLKFHLENTTGIDFDGFLADWFYGQGWPSYHLKWAQEADSLIVHVSQEQSHPSVSFFEMPIPIYVGTNEGETVYRVDHTQQNQRFSFFVGDAVVDSIAFDPAKWILSRNNTVTELTTSIGDPYANESVMLYPNPATNVVEIISPNVVTSIDAVNALGQIQLLKPFSGRVAIDDLQPGIYTFILKDEGRKVMAVKRIMVAE